MARSARCDVRRGAAVFVDSDENALRISSALDGFRRLLLQIGGANIASADRTWWPLVRRTLASRISGPSLRFDVFVGDAFEPGNPARKFAELGENLSLLFFDLALF